MAELVIITYTLAVIAFAVAAFWLCGLIFKAISDRARRVALLNLRRELNKIAWESAIKGDPWDKAIESVRAHILNVADDHRASPARKDDSNG